MWTKKAVKDMTSDEVDDEIKRLAKHYNISVDEDGGATATMSGPETAPEAKTDETPKKQETPKTAPSTPKTKAAPQPKKKVKSVAKQAYVDKPPVGATRGGKAPESKTSKSDETAQPKKQGSLGISNYHNMTQEERKQALSESRKAWAEERKKNKKKTPTTKTKSEPWRNVAGEELAKLRKKS